METKTSGTEQRKAKSFPQGIIISIFFALVCIIALCSTTYAWFTKSATNVENVIESSLFDLDITVTDSEGNPVTLTENAEGKLSCTFATPGVYTVDLKMTDDTTASKGYCDIKFNSTETLQTKSVSRDPEIGVDPFSFTIEITEANVSVTFEPKWGISADADISHGDNVVYQDN